MADRPGLHPLWLLSDADLELILRMVLASGSLKMLAQSYKISYPTIRARLNGVIERLRAAMESKQADPMAASLHDLLRRDELTPAAAQRLLDMHRKECNKAVGRSVCKDDGSEDE